MFGRIRVRVSSDFSVPRLVRYFVFSDLVLMGGWGFMAPIFSIYVIEKIEGATLITVGITAAIYWLVKSIIQLPIAEYIDRADGERDDFLVLIAGLILTGLSAFAFLLVHTLWQLYFVQFIHAIAFGMYVPSWSAIFSRHLNKSQYAISWSLDSTAVGIGSGVAGFFGGALASWFGYGAVFILAGVFSFLAALIIFVVPDLVFPKAAAAGNPIIKDHGPAGGQ